MVEYVEKYGTKQWARIAQVLPGRKGKQCRSRSPPPNTHRATLHDGKGKQCTHTHTHTHSRAPCIGAQCRILGVHKALHRSALEIPAKPLGRGHCPNR